MALEIIARSRFDGVLQSELPKMLKKSPTNFSYTLKRLYTRGVIIKTPVKLRVPGKQSQSVHTSLLHHVRFAPALAPGPIPVRCAIGKRVTAHGFGL